MTQGWVYERRDATLAGVKVEYAKRGLAV